jgi:hypothetical protein
MIHTIARKILLTAALLGTAMAPLSVQAAGLNAIPFRELPRYSSIPHLPGAEPVTSIYVGTEQQLIRLYVDHGYSGADPITPANILKAYRAAKTNAPYPTAPFTPAFINRRVQDLSFQLPTATNSVAQRHHTRIWLTDSTTTDGRLVWVATSSLDTSVATAGSTILPAHHIDPNLNAERDFTVHSLGLNNVPYVQFMPAQSGHNPLGDPFYTDGRAAVIDLGRAPVGTPKPVAQPTSVAQPSQPSQATIERFKALLRNAGMIFH